MTGGGDLQMQPITQEGRLWKAACEATEQRAEAAEARAARFAELNERTINETHAGWMAARADADRWENAVKAILAIAGLSPALSAAEAAQAMQEELERRSSAVQSTASTHRSLEQAIRWCRPRLSKDVYRSALDRMVLLPPAEPIAGEPRIVQSSKGRR